MTPSAQLFFDCFGIFLVTHTNSILEFCIVCRACVCVIQSYICQSKVYI